MAETFPDVSGLQSTWRSQGAEECCTAGLRKSSSVVLSGTVIPALTPTAPVPRGEPEFNTPNPGIPSPLICPFPETYTV